MAHVDPHELIASQQRTIAALTASIERLTAEVAELKRLLFGQSRERVAHGKMPPVDRSLRKREDEDEAAVLARRLRAKEKRAARALKKKQLPVVEVRHHFEACPHCASRDLEDMHTEVDPVFWTTPSFAFPADLSVGGGDEAEKPEAI